MVVDFVERTAHQKLAAARFFSVIGILLLVIRKYEGIALVVHTDNQFIGFCLDTNGDFAVRAMPAVFDGVCTGLTCSNLYRFQQFLRKISTLDDVFKDRSKFCGG